MPYKSNRAPYESCSINVTFDGSLHARAKRAADALERPLTRQLHVWIEEGIVRVEQERGLMSPNPQLRVREGRARKGKQITDILSTWRREEDDQIAA